VEKFYSFSYLQDILTGSFVKHYGEFDDSNRCYYEAVNVFPQFQRKGAELNIALINIAERKVEHLIGEENDFDYGTLEIHSPKMIITLYSKSGYRYVFEAKKL
jgi:hypothetical protein